MNTKWKRIWLRALRAGHYKQGKSSLRRPDNTCCCLGVIADQMGCTWFRNRNSAFEWKSSRGVGGAEYLNDQTRLELGITTDQQRKLATMNDSGGSFKKIADYIENNL